jgi:hypothetical protein
MPAHAPPVSARIGSWERDDGAIDWFDPDAFMIDRRGRIAGPSVTMIGRNPNVLEHHAEAACGETRRSVPYFR